MIIRKNGNQEWWINGVRHRDNGPAIETKDGTNIWYQHGKIHRENGPALTTANGYCEWRINDRLHRSNGPAIIWPSGASRWFYDGYHIEKYDIPFDFIQYGKPLFVGLIDDRAYNPNHIGWGFIEKELITQRT